MSSSSDLSQEDLLTNLVAKLESDTLGDDGDVQSSLTTDLAEISPEEAIEMYLADREQELRGTSIDTIRSALRFFKRWCEKEEIENLNDLTGRHLHRYRIWRRDEAPTKTDTLSKWTEKSQQKILKRFVRYCEQINAVTPDLHSKVRIPSVPDDEVARSDTITTEEAQEILRYLSDFEYASLEHVTWLLLAETGGRIGMLVALDVDDYRPEENPPHLRVRHRPESGTKLKNGANGERLVAISRNVCSVIDDYLENNRPDVVDDHGRVPLLATVHGRIAKGTVRKYVYMWSRPCAVGNGCPHDRDPENCEAIKANSASKCPSSKSPHAIRRGYISHQLSTGVERSFVGGRCDVSDEVIETHYDARDEYEKMETRRKALDLARRDHTGYGGR